jgi:dipeptidyl aminopeptidase/acylaminoacyl peptidase
MLRDTSILRLAAALLALVSAPVLSNTQSAPITIDDLLKSESLGDVAFSPDGRQIVFTREIPLDERVTTGLDEASIAGKRVFVAARAGGPAKEIVGDAGVRYQPAFPNTWAPDSRGLLMLATSEGAYGLAYWDATSGKVTALPGRADSRYATFAWAGSRVVYPVLSDAAVQLDANRQMLDGLNGKWRAAWSGGKEAQVTVSSANPVFQMSSPPPGSLMLADPPRARAVKIAEGEYAGVFVSPDGRQVAAVRAAEEIADSFYYRGGRGELQIFELSADGARLAWVNSDLDVDSRSVSWSPDGRRLLVGGKPVGARVSAARLYDFDARNGRRREIAPPGLSFNNPDVGAFGLLPTGWIGDRPVAIAARRDVGAERAPSAGTRLDYGETQNVRFDLYALDAGGPRNLSEFAKTSVDGFLVPERAQFALVITDTAVWRLAPGRKPHRLSAMDARPIVAFSVVNGYPAPPLRTAYFRAGDAERVAVVAISEQGKPERMLLDLKSGGLSASAAREDIVASAPDLLATVSKIADGWTSSLVLNDGGERTLAAVNEALRDKPVAPAEMFTYTVDGQTLTGWVVTPPGARPGTPLPAVVSVYGGVVFGPETPWLVKPGEMPNFSSQLWAAQGFAVIYPSTPLGAGADTDVMGTLANQVVAAVDALAAKGVVDARRVGVTGQSFGGFSTAAILAKRSDRFRAGVAMAGVYDWQWGYGLRSQAQTLTDDGSDRPFETEMIETGQIRLAKPFWNDPAPYIRNSPIFQVENINAPLLLLHGDLDMAMTGLQGAERMYHALVRAGKKPTLVRYWGEGHVAQSAWAIRDQHMRMMTWFKAYLVEPE